MCSCTRTPAETCRSETCPPFNLLPTSQWKRKHPVRNTRKRRVHFPKRQKVKPLHLKKDRVMHKKESMVIPPSCSVKFTKSILRLNEKCGNKNFYFLKRSKSFHRSKELKWTSSGRVRLSVQTLSPPPSLSSLRPPSLILQRGLGISCQNVYERGRGLEREGE